MKFTDEQKLIIAMLCDISKGLKIRGDVDPALVSSAIWGGNEWALPMEYTFLFEQEASPPHVKHVIDVLDMWSFIEPAFAALDDDEKKRFAAEAYDYGAPSWSGFDGNEETNLFSAASFLIEDMGRFRNFNDGRELNSHHPTIDRDTAMLAAFEPIRKTIGAGAKRRLSVDDLIEIFQAGYPH